MNGRDISRAIKADARLISLTLTESRGDEADQLDIERDDSDGALNLPRKAPSWHCAGDGRAWLVDRRHV